MRLLVTGNKGYLGAVMVPILLAAGHEVVGLDSDLFEECTFGPDVQSEPELRIDLRDVQRSHLEGFDAVIHLAALSNDPLGDLNPNITYDINHAATVRLARLAREAGVGRFLYSSSCSSYGRAGDTMVDETAELNPITPTPSRSSASSRTWRSWRMTDSVRRSSETRPPTASRRVCDATSC